MSTDYESFSGWMSFQAISRFRPSRLLLGCLLSVPLTACVVQTPYPLNMTEEEWIYLGQESRTLAQEKDAELREAKSRQNYAENRAGRAWAAVKLAEEKRDVLELDIRRREARYGERVLCWLEDAEIYRAKKWRDLKTVTIDIVTNVDVPFELVEKKDSYYTTERFAQFDGKRVKLCRTERSCVEMAGSFTQYQQGLEGRIETSELRGQLRCYFLGRR